MAVVRDGQESESSASSATEGLAIPENHDASSRVLLDGFAIIGVSACRVGASDDDNSFGALIQICTADTTGFFGIKSRRGRPPHAGDLDRRRESALRKPGCDLRGSEFARLKREAQEFGLLTGDTENGSHAIVEKVVLA
jgi:hypothetical protein